MSTTTQVSVAAHPKFEPVIGLEVHVHLLTETKIFCSCSTRFGARPNTNVCPVCLGMPGALPVLNRKVVEFATLAAMALNCRINETSIFARKNYFYPDLPKGYQISQYDKPLAEFGYIEVPSSGGKKKIGITRVHLEEDAGKSLHEGFPDSEEKTAIDLNRTGVPLIEIVSEPDISTPDEAYEYLTRLKEIILYTGVSDCNMEEGSLRADANVSVRPRGQKKFGTKTEIKNVNSFRFIREALEYEIGRQIDVIDSGGTITQETRLYNANEGKTYSMRSKEQAHDYRYFPEPDLLPLVVDEKWKAEIARSLPELPEARRARMVKDYGISEYDAQVLTVSKSLVDQFEEAARAAKNPKRVANLVQSELMGRLKAKGMEIEQSPISMKGVAASADLVESGAISGKMLKDLYDLCFERGKDFSVVYEEEGRPQQSTDTSALEKIIDEILAANPKQVEQYRGGKKTMLGFFVGQVMKASKGQASPQVVNQLLMKKLEAPPEAPKTIYSPPPPPPGVQPIFAYQDFWPKFRTDFARLLQVLPNAQRAFASVADRGYENVQQHQHVILHLVTFCAMSMKEVMLLAGNGLGRGAIKIARGILEASINADYILKHPKQSEIYVDWIMVEQYRQLTYMRKSHSQTLSSLPAELVSKIETSFQRVRPKFEYFSKKKNKMVLRSSWSPISLASRARATRFLKQYDLIYPLASQIFHGTASGLASHLDSEDPDRLSLETSMQWVGESLIGAHGCFVGDVEVLCEAFGVQSSPSVQQLVDDFHFAWLDSGTFARSLWK